MISKIVFWFLFLTNVSLLNAEQQARIPRVGYAASGGSINNPGVFVESFRRGIRDLGYIEGENIHVEYRYPGTDPDRVSGFVEELIKLNVDVLVSSSAGAIVEAKKATKTIPIVMVASFDPVEKGIIDSYARPGGNITGLARLTHELSGKRLELFKEAVPSLSHLGIIAVRGSPSFRDYETAARVLKISLESIEVNSSKPDLDGAFRAAVRARVNGLMPVASRTLNPFTKQILQFAIKNRLPTMHEVGARVDAGGLISYSADDPALFRRAAVYVDKILRGANPSEMPVEQPTKFEIVINLKTAKQIGVTIPPNVLARADKVVR